MKVGLQCHNSEIKKKPSITMIKPIYLLSALFIVIVFLSGCFRNNEQTVGKKTIIVTYSALASIVKELVGDNFSVTSLIPNGLDPHDWAPSAKNLEAMTNAALIVRNGLGLEGGLEKAFALAGSSGVKFFTVSDHITIRKVRIGEGIPGNDPDQSAGADDPHIWMDPVTVKTGMLALSDYIKKELNVDLAENARALAQKLDALDESIKSEIQSVPPNNRKIVTGHESLGYFAQRYGLAVIGAVVPSLSTQAEESASDMAAIKRLISANKVKVVFTELGTPPKVVEALARDAGVRAVSITTHSLPQDLSYFTFMKNLSRVIAESLR